MRVEAPLWSCLLEYLLQNESPDPESAVTADCDDETSRGKLGMPRSVQPLRIFYLTIFKTGIWLLASCMASVAWVCVGAEVAYSFEA